MSKTIKEIKKENEMSDKKTLLSVWDADKFSPYITGRVLDDYNIKHPESLIIFETRVNDTDDSGYMYVAVVDGTSFMSATIAGLYKLLTEGFGEGLVRNSKVKPYDGDAVCVIGNPPV